MGGGKFWLDVVGGSGGKWQVAVVMGGRGGRLVSLPFVGVGAGGVGE